mmetsp:Transcript_23609/g.42668  ORF Transcript_23609/g.42668 Transcript_23609/m.42668 type:complete len:287 (-) Transcript_23609:284-1144(-)
MRGSLISKACHRQAPPSPTCSNRSRWCCCCWVLGVHWLMQMRCARSLCLRSAFSGLLLGDSRRGVRAGDRHARSIRHDVHGLRVWPGNVSQSARRQAARNLAVRTKEEAGSMGASRRSSVPAWTPTKGEGKGSLPLTIPFQDLFTLKSVAGGVHLPPLPHRGVFCSTAFARICRTTWQTRCFPRRHHHRGARASPRGGAHPGIWHGSGSTTVGSRLLTGVQRRLSSCRTSRSASTPRCRGGPADGRRGCAPLQWLAQGRQTPLWASRRCGRITGPGCWQNLSLRWH